MTGMEPRRSLIETVDAQTDETIIGSGLSCVYFKDTEAFGFVNLASSDIQTCHLTATFGKQLGADALVWFATAHTGHELFGTLFVVYACTDNQGGTYMKRSYTRDDNGQMVKGDWMEGPVGGWLFEVSDLDLDASWSPGESAVLLRKLGCIVEVRT